MNPRRLLISFSGGETSAYMTWRILNDPALRSRWDEILVVFANTGQENEATLEFIRDCDAHFGFGTVWIEAQQVHGVRMRARARVVTFETASREGEPFADAIRKYGIPNASFKDCTRNLKQSPIESYAEDIGWGSPGHYDLAIGIRSDESDRVSVKAKQRRIVYPLLHDVPMTKPKINFWWSQQPFRLRLRHWEGNCKWCWKKTDRKLMAIMRDTPEAFDFPRRMETAYGKHGPEFIKTTRSKPLPEDYRRVFFRKNRSVADLERLFQSLPPDFPDPDDAAQVFDADWDVGGGCGESCEVWADEE